MVSCLASSVSLHLQLPVNQSFPSLLLHYTHPPSRPHSRHSYHVALFIPCELYQLTTPRYHVIRQQIHIGINQSELCQRPSKLVAPLPNCCRARRSIGLCQIIHMAEQTPQTPPHSSEPKSGVSVESLPNELLNHIFGYLDTPPPSASTSRLRDEPDFEITHSKTTDLKVISYVSKKWRAVVLPTLFRNVQFTPAQGWHCDFDARKKAHPFFNYLKQHSLSDLVTSFTLNVPYLDPLHEEDTALVLKDLEVFWKDVFDVIDPLDVLIVAPPEALGLLTGCHIGIYDTETYEAPYHYLRLHRPLGAVLEPPISLSENPTNESSHSAPRTGNSSPDNSSSASSVMKDTGRQSILLGIRPWKSLVLNEGSFVRGYVGDFQSPAPSILTDLFGCVDIPRRAGDAASTRGRGALINPSIREISYIAIFPPEAQFAKFAYFLPPVDSVYVQFVPRNGILDDKERMNYIDSNELWFQRNSCYATIMRELFTQPPSKNYATLREFESGDSADRDAWNMAVEFVKRAGAGIGWEVESDGVFIRDPKHAVLGEETDQSELSTFGCSLYRWAWAGTATLPLTAMHIYVARSEFV